MQIFRKNREQSQVYVVGMDVKVHNIEYAAGTPAIIHYDNRQITSTCIGCTNPVCMNLSDREINCSRLNNFPHDKGANVCPVNAISWNPEIGKVEINNAMCFSCGLCASRCPLGAISMALRLSLIQQ